MPKERVMPPIPIPPAFLIQETITELMKGGGEEKQVALKLTSYVFEYQKTCSDAASLLMTNARKAMSIITK
jgi:hypothetical protein